MRSSAFADIPSSSVSSAMKIEALHQGFYTYTTTYTFMHRPRRGLNGREPQPRQAGEVAGIEAQEGVPMLARPVPSSTLWAPATGVPARGDSRLAAQNRMAQTEIGAHSAPSAPSRKSTR